MLLKARPGPGSALAAGPIAHHPPLRQESTQLLHRPAAVVRFVCRRRRCWLGRRCQRRRCRRSRLCCCRCRLCCCRCWCCCHRLVGRILLVPLLLIIRGKHVLVCRAGKAGKQAKAEGRDRLVGGLAGCRGRHACRCPRARPASRGQGSDVGGAPAPHGCALPGTWPALPATHSAGNPARAPHLHTHTHKPREPRK